MTTWLREFALHLAVGVVGVSVVEYVGYWWPTLPIGFAYGWLVGLWSWKAP